MGICILPITYRWPYFLQPTQEAQTLASSLPVPFDPVNPVLSPSSYFSSYNLRTLGGTSTFLLPSMISTTGRRDVRVWYHQRNRNSSMNNIKGGEGSDGGMKFVLKLSSGWVSGCIFQNTSTHPSVSLLGNAAAWSGCGS